MGNRDRELPGDDYPEASQQEIDRFFRYVPAIKPKADRESESDINTSDEEGFDSMKARVSRTLGIPLCEQGSCNRKAICFIRSEKRQGGEPDINGACDIHATARNTFRGKAVYEILTLEEGLSLIENRNPESPTTEIQTETNPENEQHIIWRAPQSRQATSSAEEAIMQERTRVRNLRPESRTPEPTEIEHYIRNFNSLPTSPEMEPPEASGSGTRTEIPKETESDTGVEMERRSPTVFSISSETPSQDQTVIAAKERKGTSENPISVTETETEMASETENADYYLNPKIEEAGHDPANPENDDIRKTLETQYPENPELANIRYGPPETDQESSTPGTVTQGFEGDDEDEEETENEEEETATDRKRSPDDDAVRQTEIRRTPSTRTNPAKRLRKTVENTERLADELITTTTKYAKQLNKDAAQIKAILENETEKTTEKRTGNSAMQTEKMEIQQPETKMSYAKMLAQKDLSKRKGKERESSASSLNASETDEDIGSNLASTGCLVSKPDPNARTPPLSDQKHTLWWDLSTIHADHDTIEQALVKEEIWGYSYRSRSQWLELAYKSIQLRDEALNAIVTIDERNVLTPVAPKYFASHIIFISLANAPIWDPAEVKEKITNTLSTFGKVDKLEPVRFKKNGLSTRRWNAQLHIPFGTQLVMPTVFEINEVKVHAFWAGCPPSCLNCNTPGHWQKQCTKELKDKADRKMLSKIPFAPIIVPSQPSNAQPEKEMSNPKIQPEKEKTPPLKTQPTSEKTTPPVIPPKPKNWKPRNNMGEEPEKRKVTAGKTLATQEMLLTGHIDKARKTLADKGVTIPSSSSSSEPEPESLETESPETEIPESPGFEKVINKNSEKRQKQKELKTKQAEAEKAASLNRKRAKRTYTPTSTPTNPEKKIKPEQPGQYKEKRRAVTKDQFCQYAISILGYKKESVEQIWNLNREDWGKYRDQNISKEEYNSTYDWARYPRNRDLEFKPTDYGITTKPYETEDIVHESEWEDPKPVETKTGKGKGKTIKLILNIVNPKTKKEERQTLDISEGLTIAHLRKSISEKYEVEPTTFAIYSRNRKLKTEIMGKQIKNNFELKIVGNWDNLRNAPEQAFKTVFLVDPVGNKTTFQLNPATTTKQLMHQYAGRANKAERQLNFIFKDKKLGPYQVLSNIVKDKDTIMVSSELNYLVRIKVVINGEVQTKTLSVSNEETIFDMKTRTGEAFKLSPDSFEIEKNGEILPDLDEIRVNIHDLDNVCLRFKGTSRWDINKIVEKLTPQNPPEPKDRYIILKHHDGIRWKKEAFSYKWEAANTFGDIKEHLRMALVDEELEIKYGEYQPDNKTTIKELHDIRERVLEVSKIQTIEIEMSSVGSNNELDSDNSSNY
jgi:hypothetical protein